MFTILSLVFDTLHTQAFGTHMPCGFRLKLDHPIGFPPRYHTVGRTPIKTLNSRYMHPKFTPNLNPNLRPRSTVFPIYTCSNFPIPTVHARSPGQPSNNPWIKNKTPSNAQNTARNSIGQISLPLRSDPSLLFFLAHQGLDTNPSLYVYIFFPKENNF